MHIYGKNRLKPTKVSQNCKIDKKSKPLTNDKLNQHEHYTKWRLDKDNKKGPRYTALSSELYMSVIYWEHIR